MGRIWTETWDNSGAFYSAVYGSSLVRLTPLATEGAMSLVARQGAGDRSAAPTPDLTIGRLTSGPSMTRVDVGAGRFRADFRGRAMLLVAPGVGTEIFAEAAHMLHFVGVNYARLREMCAGAGLPEDGDFGALHAGELRDAGIETVLDAVLVEAQAGNPNGALWSDGALMMLGAGLARLSSGRAVEMRGALAPWQMRRAQDYLADRLAEPVRLAELAGLLGLSPWHFARAFKAATGEPPHRYHTRLRIERGKALLEGTDLSMAQIARSLGYDSAQSFARMFRRTVGAAPSDWRDQRKG